MAQGTATPAIPADDASALVKVDANFDRAATQLTSAGWAGITLLFLSMMLLMWKHFWKKFDAMSKACTDEKKELEGQLKVERDAMADERKEYAKLLETRHEQFMSLLREGNASAAANVEVNRQTVDLMTKLGELLRRVHRAIGDYEHAQKSEEEDL